MMRGILTNTGKLVACLMLGALMWYLLAILVFAL
jgi:hypothetical protein